ncbi:MAG TPA: MltA domain-containing protein [Caulobacteraceae bacterium]
MFRAVLTVAATLVLAACASLPPREPEPWERPLPSRPTRPAQPSPTLPPPRPAMLPLSQLPGWAQEDHASAFAAYRQTCAVVRDPAYAEVCARARAEPPLGADAARRFFEANFRAESVGPEGLLTGYFAPQYEARFSRQGEFSAPVRPRPAGLPANPGTQAYGDRAAIESTEEARPLAWMRPEDLFFLQIQGSGTLRLPDGRTVRALYDGNNGWPFVAIAGPMREQGLLPGNNTSGQAIRQWLADHRGREAEAVMRLNPRYVFFRTAPDDGLDPAGAAGVPLPAGRAVAVDLTRHALGELFWIDASAPTLTGAFPIYRRLVVALDTGGAIKGDVRADLYIGRGDAAGVEAGRIRHDLIMYRLVPAPR